MQNKILARILPTQRVILSVTIPLTLVGETAVVVEETKIIGSRTSIGDIQGGLTMATAPRGDNQDGIKWPKDSQFCAQAKNLQVWNRHESARDNTNTKP
jgi:hypothetical protein